MSCKMPIFNIIVEKHCNKSHDPKNRFFFQNYPKNLINFFEYDRKSGIFHICVFLSEKNNEWVIILDDHSQFSQCDSLNVLAQYIYNHNSCDDVFYSWNKFNDKKTSKKIVPIRNNLNGFSFCTSHIDLFDFDKYGNICDISKCFRLLKLIHVEHQLTKNMCITQCNANRKKYNECSNSNRTVMCKTYAYSDNRM